MATYYVTLDDVKTDVDLTNPDPDPGGNYDDIVTSFNGRRGAVTPAVDDYTASIVTNDSSVTGAYVDDALNTIGGALTTQYRIPVVGATAGSLAMSTWSINAGAMTTPAAATISASTSLGITTAALTTSGSFVATNAAGVKTLAAATQDGIAMIGRAGGTGSYVATLTPATLTASRTITIPDLAGTLALGGSNLTTQYRMVYVSAAGTVTESSSIVTDASGNLGVGSAPAAKIHALATTEQFRASYSAAVYASHTVDASGYYTIAPTGGKVLLNGNLTITENSDTITLTHDGGNAYFYTSDGEFRFVTDEGTNTNTYVRVSGKGPGRGYIRILDEDNAEYLELTCISGASYISSKGASPGKVRLQYDGDVGVDVFAGTIEGETPTFDIAGWKMGDTGGRRTASFGVSSTADDTFNITGVSNYYFGGQVHALATTEQFRASYSAAVYASHTVDASGYYDITPTGGFVGINGATRLGTETLGVAGHMLLTKTTVQLYLAYDPSNYAHFLVSNAGRLTIKPASGGTDTRLTVDGNLTIGDTAMGTNATQTLAIKTGTAPASSPADSIQMYSADWNGAGTATPHFRNEEGTTIKLNQSLLTTDAVGFTGVTLAAATPAWAAGQIWYNSSRGCVVADTGSSGVRVNIGDELQRLVVNNTGSAIANGVPVYFSGTDTGTGLLEITPASANIANLNVADISWTTMAFDAAAGTVGRVSKYGEINSVDTSTYTVNDTVYLSDTPGVPSTTAPTAPSKIIHLGFVTTVDASVGVITADINEVARSYLTLPFNFDSVGIGASTFYVGGTFYKAPAAHKAFTQAALTQTYGTANTAYAAHVFIVAGGAGTVDTGVVGIKVTGSTMSDTGTYTASDEEVLSADITALATNQYLETEKKFVGTYTLTLYTVSGAPTTYSLNANYGFAKYEDVGDKDVTLTGIQIVGMAGATDTAADFWLIPHIATGWTYSAAAFVPGSTAIANYRTDNPTKNTLTNNEPFAWKHLGLTQLLEGTGSEGYVIKVKAGQNSTFQRAEGLIYGYIEP